MAVGGTKVNPKKFERSQIPLYVYLLPLAVLMFVVVASAVKAIVEDHGGKKNV